MKERLQKLMSQANIASRRASEEIIKAGRVKINGEVASLGDKADLRVDTVTVDGQPLARSKKSDLIYIAVHKPRDVISDEDDLGRRTVRSMVDVQGHLYPVGRLDKQSVGLVLLTNDGHIAHHLTHPRYRHEKVYRVKVEGHVNREILDKWRRGVVLEEGKTLPAAVKVLEFTKDASWLKVTLREGRKRQIRRVANMLGHPVLHLCREEIGPIKLGGLPLGKWRHLGQKEVDKLRRYVAHGERRFQKKQKRR